MGAFSALRKGEPVSVIQAAEPNLIHRYRVRATYPEMWFEAGSTPPDRALRARDAAIEWLRQQLRPRRGAIVHFCLEEGAIQSPYQYLRDGRGVFTRRDQGCMPRSCLTAIHLGVAMAKIQDEFHAPRTAAGFVVRHWGEVVFLRALLYEPCFGTCTRVWAL